MADGWPATRRRGRPRSRPTAACGPREQGEGDSVGRGVPPGIGRGPGGRHRGPERRCRPSRGPTARDLRRSGWPCTRARPSSRQGRPLRRAGPQPLRPLRDLAHGGQIFVSPRPTTCSRLPTEQATFRDLGVAPVKGIERPEQVLQLCSDGLIDDFPRAVGPAAHPHNLPTPASPLVGRTMIARRCEPCCSRCSGGHPPRLGGAGKTRLALEVAQATLPPVPTVSGGWISRRRPDTEPGRRRRPRRGHRRATRPGPSLGLPGRRGVADQDVTDRARQRRTPARGYAEVVLEAVVDGHRGARLAGDQSGAGRVAGEWSGGSRRYPIGPMSRPTRPRRRHRRRAAVRSGLGRSSRSGFVLDPRCPRAVAQICRRLDGIPSASSWRRPGSG